MKSPVVFLLLAYFIFLTKCSTDPVIIDPDSLSNYYIACKIAPDKYQVGAIISKTIPENIAIDIGGAKVVVSGNNQRGSLVEIKPGFYYSSKDSIDILPGMKYHILVTLPGGKVIKGETIVPGPFHISNNSDKDTLEYLISEMGPPLFREIVIPPQIYWTRSRHALSYELNLKGRKASVDTFVYLQELDSPDYFRKNPDSTEYIEKAIVTITAYDSSYLPYHNSYAYYHANYRDPYGENSRIVHIGAKLGLQFGQNDNLEGGMGYFASFYTITDSVVIRYKREISSK